MITFIKIVCFLLLIISMVIFTMTSEIILIIIRIKVPVMILRINMYYHMTLNPHIWIAWITSITFMMIRWQTIMMTIFDKR